MTMKTQQCNKLLKTFNAQVILRVKDLMHKQFRLGAFGGSRGAIQQAELDRSTLEQQGRTAAGMRQKGYECISTCSKSI